MKYFVALLLLLGSQMVFAGGSELANGGDVVICPDRPPELLDIYEARRLRGLVADMGPVDAPVEDQIQFALDRLSNFDPINAIIIANKYLTFSEDREIMSDVGLRDVGDSNEAFVPAGCKLEQIAIQGTRILPEDPYYIIDEKLWNQLDNQNKAALILHEIIFAVSKAKGEKVIWTSPVVRLYNSLIFSDLSTKGNARHFYNMAIGHGSLYYQHITFYDANSQTWYFQLNELFKNDQVQLISPKPTQIRFAENMRALCAHHGGVLISREEIPLIQNFVFTSLPFYSKSFSYINIFVKSALVDGRYELLEVTKNEIEEVRDLKEGYFFCKSKDQPYSKEEK